jgi:uncharacterized protein (DUF486 family)
MLYEIAKEMTWLLVVCVCVCVCITRLGPWLLWTQGGWYGHLDFSGTCISPFLLTKWGIFLQGGWLCVPSCMGCQLLPTQDSSVYRR